MKTHEHIISWLLRAAMMLVTLTSVQAAMAQQEEIEGGEAFYIYQNDGHFDGFFYDEVKQIRYSRLDTLNREHDHYVSQEIVTEDSVYRIMLTAIDSVSFYQPEIKYAKGMRFMRDEGMMDYYISMSKPDDDSFLLQFSSYLPAGLWPKVGEVLYCPDLKDYDGPFVGKVRKMVIEGGNIYVECGYVEDINDVFEQFITVDQVRNIQTKEGSMTRRRVAGYKAPKKIEGNIEEFTLFNISKGLSLKQKLFGSLDFELALNVNFGVNISSVYNISFTSWYFKHDVKTQFGVGASLGLDGELAKDIDFSSIPATSMALVLPTRIPIPSPPYPPVFYARAAPEPAAHVEAHLNVKLNTGFKAFAIAMCIESLKSFPYVGIKTWNTQPFLTLPVGWDTSGEWSISAQLNGSIQAGVKFPIEVGAQPWLEKILALKTGIQVLCGPKITGVLDLSFLTNGSEGFFSETRPKGTYDLLKNSKIDLSLFSIDPQFTAEVKTFGTNWKYKDVTSLSFGNFTLHVFPTIKDLSYEVTGDQMNIVKAKCKQIKGETCFPQRIGFGLYKQKDENDKEYSELYRYVTRNETYFINTFNDFDLTMEDVAPGVYKAIPIVSTPLGVVAVETDEQTITVAPQEVELDPKSITAEEEGGKFEVELQTSIKQKLTASPDDDWIEAEIKHSVGTTKATIMYVTVKANETERFRKSGVTVTQVLKDGSLCERKLEVKQYGGLELSMPWAVFEADGGEQTVDILTSYNPITINLNGNDDWLSYKLDDRKLTLTAKKNEGIERKATITVAAWSKKHNGITTVELKVVQKGPVDVSLDKDALTFKANGGSEQVNLTLGGNYAFTGVRVSKVDESWLIVEKHDNYFITTAIPNTEEEEINSVIELVFTKVKQGVPGPATYVAPFYITQEAATPEPKGFTINSLSLGTAFGLTCTNLDKYKERPYEGWEPAKKANMAFYYDNGDEDRSAVITIIDENTLLLECKKEIEETDPEYPGWLTKTVETFTATLTKSKEEKEDEFEEDIIHIRVSDVHHVRDYTEVYEDTKYTNHSEYTIAPNQKLSVMAYPTIYTYDHDDNLHQHPILQYYGSLLYNGFRKSYGNVFGTMSFYEEFSWDNGTKVQKYVYANDPDETDGISLQIHFDPDSQWDAWLEDKQVYDAFEARRKQ